MYIPQNAAATLSITMCNHFKEKKEKRTVVYKCEA